MWWLGRMEMNVTSSAQTKNETRACFEQKRPGKRK